MDDMSAAAELPTRILWKRSSIVRFVFELVIGDKIKNVSSASGKPKWRKLMTQKSIFCQAI